MDPHTCHYCNRVFSCKTALDRHKFGSCLWIHTTPKKERCNELDIYEPILNDSQRDNMIRHLLLHVTKMNEKMLKMEKELTSLKRKQKKDIIQHLNSNVTQPQLTFVQWFRKITVTQRHLELVFQKNMCDSIIETIVNELDSSKVIGYQLPIQSFQQKPNILYIYNIDGSNKKWNPHELSILKKCFTIIASKISDMFLVWQEENIDFSDSSEETQDKLMIYTKKIMDDSYNKGPFINKAIDKIYQKTKSNIQTVIFD